VHGASAAVACGFLVILGVPVAHAQTYKVQVYADVGELDMKIEPIPHDDVLVVRLTNHSPGRVRCDLLYDAAPRRRLARQPTSTPARPKKAACGRNVNGFA